ncbi:MAG: flagellar assembly protein FliW [Opitutaceae bacterium]|jgi:flagellar assembly factor FliW
MKVSSELITADTAAGHMLKLPQGLIGFPQHTSFELLYQPDQLPFRWMRLHGPEIVHFVVIEPQGIIPDYEPELFDEDAASLGITSPTDALVLNIVTVSHGAIASATANLIGPIIVNRRTGVAKQVVLANHSRYDARYPLVVAENSNT